MPLQEGIANAIIQALGTGPGHHYAGDAEGQVDFYAAGQANYEPTVLQGGADGTTSYTWLAATFVAPEATTISTVALYGTTGMRLPASRKQFAVEGSVNQSLAKGESYTVYWVVRGEI